MNYTSILLATDFGEKTEAAERMALSLSQALDASLHVVSAVEPIIGVDPSDAADFEEFYDKLVDRVSHHAKTRETAWSERGIEAGFHVEIGRRSEVILARAKAVNADIVVMGRRHYEESIPLGTTSQKVFFGTTVPVLFVPETA